MYLLVVFFGCFAFLLVIVRHLDLDVVVLVVVVIVEYVFAHAPIFLALLGRLLIIVFVEVRAVDGLLVHGTAAFLGASGLDLW